MHTESFLNPLVARPSFHSVDNPLARPESPQNPLAQNAAGGIEQRFNFYSVRYINSTTTSNPWGNINPDTSQQNLYSIRPALYSANMAVSVRPPLPEGKVCRRCYKLVAD
jgi:hypothetical protein